MLLMHEHVGEAGGSSAGISLWIGIWSVSVFLWSCMRYEYSIWCLLRLHLNL